MWKICALNTINSNYGMVKQDFLRIGSNFQPDCYSPQIKIFVFQNFRENFNRMNLTSATSEFNLDLDNYDLESELNKTIGGTPPITQNIQDNIIIGRGEKKSNVQLEDKTMVIRSGHKTCLEFLNLPSHSKVSKIKAQLKHTHNNYVDRRISTCGKDTHLPAFECEHEIF